MAGSPVSGNKNEADDECLCRNRLTTYTCSHSRHLTIIHGTCSLHALNFGLLQFFVEDAARKAPSWNDFEHVTGTIESLQADCTAQTATLPSRQVTSQKACISCLERLLTDQISQASTQLGTAREQGWSTTLTRRLERRIDKLKKDLLDVQNTASRQQPEYVIVWCDENDMDCDDVERFQSTETARIA